MSSMFPVVVNSDYTQPVVSANHRQKNTKLKLRKKTTDHVQKAQKLKETETLQRMYERQEVARKRFEAMQPKSFHKWEGFKPFSKHFTPKAIRPAFDNPFGTYRAPLGHHFRRPPTHATGEMFSSYDMYLKLPSKGL